MTASAVYAVLQETHRTGSREMRLVATQKSIAEPPALRRETDPLGHETNPP